MHARHILLALPPEIAEHALSFAHPNDVAHFAQSCRSARALIYSTADNNFWRQLYLAQPWDDLRLGYAVDTEDRKFAWMEEVQRRTRMERMASLFAGANLDDRMFMLETFLDLITSAPPYSSDIPELQHSQTLEWLEKLLDETGLRESFTDDVADPEEQELYARIKSAAGLVTAEDDSDARKTTLNEVRRRARCFVYNLNNYGLDNYYSTFRREKGHKGQVHWYFHESVQTVVTMNFREIGADNQYDVPPAGLQATRAYSAVGSQERDVRDWAGVEGHWHRYVCFMDYRDLFAFNFNTTGDGPLNADYFDKEDFQEATRLIDVHLHVVNVADPIPPPPKPAASHSPSSSISSDDSEYFPSERARAMFGRKRDAARASPVESLSAVESSSSSTDSDDASLAAVRRLYDTRRPTIYFEGTSRGGYGHEARVKGCVRTTPDGQVRWQFQSTYNGNAQWSSEGIQIGNVCSAAGVAGTWTGAHHEEGDPAGPFWIWKVPEDHQSKFVHFP